MVYKVSVHKEISSYSGLPTFSTDSFTIETKEEFDQVHKLCQDGTNMAGFIKSIIVPIRTDLTHIFDDLFFPTLINVAFKIKILTNVPFIFLAIVCDVISLKIRLFTLIPRAIYNNFAPRKEHPLTPYLIQKGIAHQNCTGEIKIRVYEQELKEGKEQYHGIRYQLYLSDQDTPRGFHDHLDCGFGGLGQAN